MSKKFQFIRLTYIVGTTNKYDNEEKAKMRKKISTLKQRISDEDIHPFHAAAQYNIIVGMLHQRGLAMGIAKVEKPKPPNQ